MTAVLNGVTSLPTITHTVELISSETARQWLEMYKGPNRRISESKVFQFQSDMESGLWVFEGAPIRISNTGKLLDGQHRLTALANMVPGGSIPFLVIRGLPDDAQLYMDQGQARTVGQQLALKGVSNPSLSAAVVRLYLDWTRNRLFTYSTKESTSKPEVTQWVLNHQELIGKLFETGFQSVDAPSSVVGAFALATMQKSPARTFRFLHQLATGVGLQEGDPILALDRRLRNIRRSGIRLSQREYLAYFIRAWNAWVTGERLQKMQLNRLTAENYPELLQVEDLPPVVE